MRPKCPRSSLAIAPLPSVLAAYPGFWGRALLLGSGDTCAHREVSPSDLRVWLPVRSGKTGTPGAAFPPGSHWRELGWPFCVLSL